MERPGQDAPFLSLGGTVAGLAGMVRVAGNLLKHSEITKDAPWILGRACLWNVLIHIELSATAAERLDASGDSCDTALQHPGYVKYMVGEHSAHMLYEIFL